MSVTANGGVGGVAAGAGPVGGLGGTVLGNAKNAFLMTSHPTNGGIAGTMPNGTVHSTVTANGSVYAIRETST